MALRAERPRFAGLLARSALMGAAMGVALFAAGSLILYEAGGALPAAAGVVATFAMALAAGLWAGAPAARDVDTPPSARWVGAGLAMAAGGVVGTAWQVAGGERGGGAARAVALLFLVGIPVYALGFLLPVQVAWERRSAPAADDDDGDEDGAAAALSAAGTAAAGLLAGLGAGAALAGLVLLPGLSPGPLMLAVAAALVMPLLVSRPAAPAAAGERLLLETETPYSTLRVAEIVFPGGRQPELRLYQDEEIESGELSRSGAPTFAYVAAAERWLAEGAPAGASYLFLGGGAYTLPRRIAERDPAARITVVELDPEVTRTAYRYFGLRPEHGIDSLHGDARRVAEALPPGGFDRVFLDVYDGTEHTPHHLVTREAFAVLRGLLRPGGRFLMNAIGVAAGEGHVRLWSAVRTAASVFPSSALYSHLGPDFPDRQNFLVAGAAEPDAPLPARAGAFDPWPHAGWPETPGITVLRDRLDGAGG